MQAPNEIDPESFKGIEGGFRRNKPIRTVACFSLLQRCAMNGVKQINLVCAHNRRRALPLTFLFMAEESAAGQGDVAYV